MNAPLTPYQPYLLPEYRQTDIALRPLPQFVDELQEEIEQPLVPFVPYAVVEEKDRQIAEMQKFIQLQQQAFNQQLMKLESEKCVSEMFLVQLKTSATTASEASNKFHEEMEKELAKKEDENAILKATISVHEKERQINAEVAKAKDQATQELALELTKLDADFLKLDALIREIKALYKEDSIDPGGSYEEQIASINRLDNCLYPEDRALYTKVLTEKIVIRDQILEKLKEIESLITNQEKS